MKNLQAKQVGISNRLDEIDKQLGGGGQGQSLLDEADRLNARYRAGGKIRDALIRTNENGTTPIDDLLDATKKLRFDKISSKNVQTVDRLSQWLGSDEKAQAFENQIKQAKLDGVHMVRNVWIARILGLVATGKLGAAAHAAGEVAP